MCIFTYKHVSDERRPWKLTFAFYAQIDGSDQAIFWPWMRFSIWTTANSTRNVLFRNLFNEPNRSGWVVREQRAYRGEELSVHHKIWKRQRCTILRVYEMLTISVVLAFFRGEKNTTLGQAFFAAILWFGADRHSTLKVASVPQPTVLQSSNIDYFCPHCIWLMAFCLSKT